MLSALRFALRQLAKAPGFTAVVVLTLALGIGANSAVFTVIHSTLLRPLPFDHPEELVQIWKEHMNAEYFMASGVHFQHWRDDNTLLDSIAALHPVSLTATGGGASAEQLQGYGVSASYLRVLRLRPILGEDFPAHADRFGGPNRVVILSHSLWKTRYGGDPRVINGTLRLDGVDHTIVGVLAPDALPRSDVRFLRPVVLDDPARLDPLWSWAVVLGRMKPGVSPTQLTAELIRIHERHVTEYPADFQPLKPVVIPFRENFTGSMRATFVLLSAAATVLLLIACANVANLLLVRAIARRREIAVRLALGAGPRRIFAQLLGESLVLALLGGGVAVIVAMHCTSFLGPIARAVPTQASTEQRYVLDRLMGESLPSMLQPHVDWTVLGFSLAVAIVTTLLFGVVPALRACRADLLQDLKIGRGGSGGRSPLQSVLVAAQIGLTTLLLISTGLLVRSFARILAVDPGFDAQRTIAFQLVTPRASFPGPEHLTQFSEQVVARMAALPGVEAVGTITKVPFRKVGKDWVGRADEPDRTRHLIVVCDSVNGDAFRALGIPLQRGRGFTPADAQPGAAPVVIIDETLAQALFSGRDPLGQEIRWTNQTETKVWTVVGISGATRWSSLGNPPETHLYAPRASARSPFIVVRTGASAAALTASIRQAVRAIDPDQPLSDLHPISEDISRSVSGKRANLGLVAVFGVVALALACIGIYGVLAFTVGQRERELGIRLALGAPQRGLLTMVLRDGLRLTLIGIAVGLLAAVASSRLIASLLFSVEARDPLVFAAVAVLLSAAAAAACFIPARRAAKVDPMVALRAE